MNDKFDIIVAGGGFAGVGAALAAARKGKRVMLFDKHNCCGGAAVGNLVNPFMPHATYDPETNEKIVLSRGIFSEIINELQEHDAVRNSYEFNEEFLKLILNRMLLKENVTLLYNSYLTSANVNNGKIESVNISNKSGTNTYFADYFIDATGDGDLSVLSGCNYQLGRSEDNLCQPMTLCFRLANIDADAYFKELPEIQKLYKQYREEGKIKNIREDVLTFRVLVSGVLHFNSTRIVKLNPVNAEEVTKAEIEAREQAFELYMFLKENFESCKNCELLSTASEIGVRESRMIEGEYLLTEQDLVNCTKFPDSIAAGNYDIDIHNPEGSGTSHYYFKPGEYYTIPYRCLTPKATDNLLVAGRCISSTHEAQASYRIMPICCCLGEAAGVAAALAHRDSKSVKAIDISELQTILRNNGAML